MQAGRKITFGRFRLDLTNECLWQGTRAISLRPKAFAVLKLLVERPGLLVTKQQVLDTVWPDTLPRDSSRVSTLSEGRASFTDALTNAKRQGARSWELRAALSMHRLDLALGNPNHTQLAQIYSSFTEGFETADLKRARSLLETAGQS